FISIDNNELTHLNKLLENKFGFDSLYGPIIVQVNKGGRDYLPIALTHEYLVCGSLYNNPNSFHEIRDPTKETSLKYKDYFGRFQIRELRNRNPKFNRKNRPNLFYPFYINPNFKHADGFCPVSLEETKEHTIKVVPLNSKGIEDCWRWGKELARKNIDPTDPDKSNLVARQRKDKKWNIYEKYRSITSKAKSIWDESEMRTENGSIYLRNMFYKLPFDYPKPVDLVKRCIEIGTNKEGIVLDFFAGSGTTGNAVINLNTEDNGARRFILIEMSNYFKTVLIPRISKIIYTDNWKDGKPLDNNGSRKQIIKYHYLEQYEDSLQNIEFKKVNSLLNNSKDYVLKYMLDFESNDSPVFLNIDRLDNPFDYKLKIMTENGLKIQKVDLIETFNYIAGIFVDSIVKKKKGDIDYVIVKGYREEKRVIVIWRNKPESFDPREDKEFVEKEIIKGEEFDEIFVNGNSLINKAIALDEIFKKGMFVW
ncbi:MAG: DNA methyltransferase, partial [Promethearchaeota archaeon]